MGCGGIVGRAIMPLFMRVRTVSEESYPKLPVGDNSYFRRFLAFFLCPAQRKPFLQRTGFQASCPCQQAHRDPFRCGHLPIRLSVTLGANSLLRGCLEVIYEIFPVFGSRGEEYGRILETLSQLSSSDIAVPLFDDDLDRNKILHYLLEGVQENHIGKRL